MKITEAMESFFMSMRVEEKSPATLEGYKYGLRFFLEATGDIEVEDLTPNHIRKFMVWDMARVVHGHPQSKQSRKKRFAVVRSFVRWMYTEKIIDVRITDTVKGPNPGKPLPHLLSDEQVKTLLKYAKAEKTYRDYVIMELFLDTGCRLAEVAALSMEDVNFDERYIRVTGKGSKEAIVPFGNRVARDLHAYVYQHRKANPGENALFIADHGGKLGRDGLKIMVRRALMAIGIEEKAGAHIFRHTFATNFLRRGGRIEELQIILRHDRIETTQVYTHLTATDALLAHHRASPMDNMK
jgi:site-specific recombinase XerD